MCFSIRERNYLGRSTLPQSSLSSKEMVWKPLLVLPALFLNVLCVLQPPNALNLRVTKNATVDIPSTLYGYMWEVSGFWFRRMF